MVNKNSKNKEAAIEFVKYMTSPELEEVQRDRARRSCRRDPPSTTTRTAEANPYYESLKSVFAGGAVARPSTVSADLYNDVLGGLLHRRSTRFSTGQKDSKTAVADLETDMKRF